MRTLLQLTRGLRLAVVAAALAGGPLQAQISTNLPPRPAGYFTDQAGLVDAASASAINEELAQFERDTSNQILVAIFPKVPDGADPSQYAIDTGNAWQAGQKGKDNGAVLLVYAQDHQAFIATGRGLEGALPDITCHEIIEQNLVPAFRQGNYAGGIEATLQAMEAAAKGEYQGTGATHLESQDSSGSGGIPFWVVLLVIVLLIVAQRYFPSPMGGAPFIYTGGGWGGGGFGGGFGGGGGGGGGFSGFSGGGGSFGGGGAGGRW